jgi:hypothetical protein
LLLSILIVLFVGVAQMEQCRVVEPLPDEPSRNPAWVSKRRSRLPASVLAWSVPLVASAACLSPVRVHPFATVQPTMWGPDHATMVVGVIPDSTSAEAIHSSVK